MTSLKALIISENEIISDGVKEELEKNYCRVDRILPSEINKLLKDNGLKKRNYDYIVAIGLGRERKSRTKKGKISRIKFLDNSIKLAKKISVKTVFVFPCFSTKETQHFLRLKERILKEDIFATVLFTVEVYKGREIVTEGGPFGRLINSLKKKGTVKIERNTQYHLPLKSKKLAKTVVNKLFSISSFGRAEVILTNPISQKVLLGKIQRASPGRKIRLVDYESSLKIDVRKKEHISVNKKEVLESLINNNLWRKKDRINYEKDASGTRQKKFFRLKVNRILFKGNRKATRGWFIKDAIKHKQKKALVFVLSCAILPFIMLITNIFFFRISIYTARGGYLRVSRNVLVLTKEIFNLTDEYSRLLSKVPFVGYPYLYVSEVSGLLSKNSEIIERTIDVKERLLIAAGKLLADKDININDFSNELYLEIGYLEKELAFFRSDIKESSSFAEGVMRWMINYGPQLEIDKLESYSEIVKSLPTLLGVENKSTYLFVMQNNNVARASGGVIESVLFVTLSKGKIQDIEAFGVEELDRRLMGVIKPPLPLIKYFEKNTWTLRDANWYSDFKESAEQIEWFIDKQIDKPVDGVLAINFSILKDLMPIFKQIVIEENGKVVNRENIDEVLGNIEQEFYPDNKAQDVSGLLLKNMLEKINKMDMSEKSRLLDTIIGGLNNKEIQIFTHDNESREAFSKIGWDGSISLADCGNNCYKDYLGIIESSLESSSAGILNRHAYLNVSIEEGVIKRRLVFIIENETGERINGRRRENNIYKGYIRLLTPPDAGIGLVEIVREDKREEVKPEIFGIQGKKEIGVDVKITEGEAIALIFSWESGVEIELHSNGGYGIMWVKQSGIEEYPIEVNIKVNADDIVFEYDNLSLTGENSFGYNTNLSRDIISRIFWKNGIKN